MIFPQVRKLTAENKKLKKKLNMYMKMYQAVSDMNAKYQDTLEEVIAYSQNSKKKKKNKAEAEMTFHQTELEDAEQKKAELASSLFPYGMAGADYTGEPVKYQSLTDADIEGLFDFCYNNTSKEVNLDLGSKATAILESHPDKSLSVEIYEDGRHLKSMKTGVKKVGDEVVSDYDDEDIIEVLSSYGKKDSH